MSWRRLCVLIAGLSPRSVWRLIVTDRPISGPAAERAFEAWMR